MESTFGLGNKRDRITPKALRKHFHEPLVHAAKALGVSVSHLKTICREHGIKRWPYRKVLDDS